MEDSQDVGGSKDVTIETRVENLEQRVAEVETQIQSEVTGEVGKQQPRPVDVNTGEQRIESPKDALRQVPEPAQTQAPVSPLDPSQEQDPAQPEPAPPVPPSPQDPQSQPDSPGVPPQG